MSDPDAIAYTYNEADNTEERPNPIRDEPPLRVPIAYIPGVPLRDLTVADVEALPEHLHRSVAASPLFKVTSDAPKAPEEPPDPDAPAEDAAPRRRSRAKADDTTKEG